VGKLVAATMSRDHSHKNTTCLSTLQGASGTAATVPTPLTVTLHPPPSNPPPYPPPPQVRLSVLRKEEEALGKEEERAQLDKMRHIR
jgi:hypothetical protein